MEAYFSAHPLKPFIPYSRQHAIILFIMLVGIIFYINTKMYYGKVSGI